MRNPALPPGRQKTDTRITLELLEDFVYADGAGKEISLSDYYQASGPGLPFDSEKYAAILDSVIVFQCKRD